MIDPDSLIAHAEELAGRRPGRPAQIDLRRGVSAAYYAIYHELTGLVVGTLVGSVDATIQNQIRRSLPHRELAGLAKHLSSRASTIANKPAVPLPKELQPFAGLADVAAGDPHLVAALRTFQQLQEQRHLADYDHDFTFDKAALEAACNSAGTALDDLRASTTPGRQAFSTMVANGRRDLKAP